MRRKYIVRFRKDKILGLSKFELVVSCILFAALIALLAITI